MKNKRDQSSGLGRPEDEAFERFAAGEEGDSAFEDALPAFERQVKKYLIIFGIKGEMLDEVAQEALVRVYLKRASLLGKGVPSIKTWIRTVCHNLKIDLVRNRQKYANRITRRKERAGRPTCGPVSKSREKDGQALSAEDLPSLENDPELREILDLCIEQLPGHSQIIFELRYLLDVPTNEIADVVDKGIRLIQTELKRSRESLANCLRYHGYAIETRKGNTP